MTPMHPKTLPQDILALLSEDVEVEVDESLLNEAAEQFKSALRRRLSRQERRGGLRMSSIGKPGCQLWHQENEPEHGESLPPQTQLKFLYGDLLEILLIFLTKASGHDVTHEQHEVEVDGVKGHTDCVIDGVPVDVKSASDYAFQKFKEGRLKEDDAFGYIPQLSGYAHALGNTKEAGFLVINKVTGAICWDPLDEATILENAPSPIIQQQRENLSADRVPFRYPPVPDGKSGNLKLTTRCGYCNFKHRCWRDANNNRGLRTFIYSTGPRYLTAVGKEPNVYEV